MNLQNRINDIQNGIRIQISKVFLLAYPSINEKEVIFNTKIRIEWLFFLIINWLRNRVGKQSISEVNVVWYDFIFKWITIFTFLLIITSLILFLPIYLLLPNDQTKVTYCIEMILLIIFFTTIWTGFVYSLEEFRYLIKNNVLPLIKKNHSILSKEFLRFYFNGTRTFLLSGVIGIFFIGIIIYVTLIIVFNVGLLLILPTLFSFILTTALFYIVIYIGINSFLILFWMFLFLCSNPLEINPYIEMGGIENYGNFVLNCLCLIAFSIAAIPLLIFATQNFPHFSQFFNQIMGNMTLNNITVGYLPSIQQNVFNTIHEVPISNITNSISIYILIFAFFAIISLLIITCLNVKIAMRKQKEIKILKEKISKINFLGNQNSFENKQYLLFLYEQVSNLNELPIKKTLLIQLLLSIITGYLFIKSLFNSFFT